MKDRPDYILFLDFDGVTHPVPGQVPSTLAQLRERGVYGDGPFFCRDNVLQVNRLIHQLNARVVITSSWRLEFGWKPFRPLFLGRVVGQTPPIDFHSRYQEVKLYLERSGQSGAPWLALDDNELLYPDTEERAHITDGAVGMTAREVDTLLSRFGKGGGRRGA